MSKLQIVLADDHAVVRAGLELLINAQADMEVVGQAASGREAVEQAHSRQPDVIVLDVSMPDLDGAVAAEQIQRESPDVRVLVLTRHADQGYLRRMLRAGAVGYVIKKTAADQLIYAIRSVANGGVFIDPSLTAILVEQVVGHSPSIAIDPLSSLLTKREAEVLHQIAWGLSNKEIAAQLGISIKTVEYHKASATHKLSLHSRAEIVRYALAHGWLQEDQDLE
jgi:two-component system response regulator NreC